MLVCDHREIVKKVMMVGGMVVCTRRSPIQLVPQSWSLFRFGPPSPSPSNMENTKSHNNNNELLSVKQYLFRSIIANNFTKYFKDF